MAGEAETHPVPGSAAPARILAARQPGTGATWTSPPRPHVDPRPAPPPARPLARPRPRRRALPTWAPAPPRGRGGRQVLPGKSSPHTPRAAAKKELRRRAGGAAGGIPGGSASLHLQSESPPGPRSRPRPRASACPGVAAGVPPLRECPPRATRALPALPSSPQRPHAGAPSLSRGVHVSPPGTRRSAASRGPPATLSPAPRRPRRPRSRAALGSSSPNRRREPHRQGRAPGPQPETARLGLSVPGAPPSWPLNTQRCSDRRRRLAQPIVGRELHLPTDTARLRIPEGRAASHSCTLEENEDPDLPRGFLGIVVPKGRLGGSSPSVLQGSVLWHCRRPSC